MFAEERPALGPLPLEPFRYYQYGHRTVHLDGCVEIASTYYSAPPGWIGRRVHVQWNAVHVRLLDPRTGQLLREHLRATRGWRTVAKAGDLRPIVDSGEHWFTWPIDDARLSAHTSIRLRSYSRLDKNIELKHALHERFASAPCEERMGLVKYYVEVFGGIRGLAADHVRDYACNRAKSLASAHASPCFCRHQITPKTSRYTRCSMSMLPNVSINRRTRSSGQLGRALSRRLVLAMIKRRALAADLPPSTCCHTFRATGITAYLSNGGTLEHAQQIAGHASPKTTKLYDRTADTITIDEIERIVI